MLLSEFQLVWPCNKNYQVAPTVTPTTHTHTHINCTKCGLTTICGWKKSIVETRRSWHAEQWSVARNNRDCKKQNIWFKGAIHNFFSQIRTTTKMTEQPDLFLWSSFTLSKTVVLTLTYKVQWHEHKCMTRNRVWSNNGSVNHTGTARQTQYVNIY